MSHKEEAMNLVYKMSLEHDIPYDYAKECALIAVDLHLTELSKMKLIFSDREIHLKNWEKIKQEIEKL